MRGVSADEARFIALVQRDDLLHCKVCMTNMLPEEVLGHVAKCWLVVYDSLDDVPKEAPPEVWERLVGQLKRAVPPPILEREIPEGTEKRRRPKK